MAIVGLVAISAGWIQSEGGTTTTIATPLATPAADRGDGEDGGGNIVNEIYRRDGQGVAFIQAEIERTPEAFNPFGPPEPEGGASSGSGFVIDREGHMLTNNHVVEDATSVEVKLGDSEKAYEAEVVGADPATDVALLKVDAPEDALHPLTLGRSGDLEVGDPVVAIGNPFGLDRTVTSGIVSALQRQIRAPNGFAISNVIQTDAAINPGNSGGPLINAAGEVIGINSQIQTGGGGGGNVGIGFAVPIDTVRASLDELKSEGSVSHAYIGIEAASITPELAGAINLPTEQGVLVQSVVEDGPADRAGVEGGTTAATLEGTEVRLGGDIIVEADGEKLGDMEDLISVVNASKPGDEVELKILRDGEPETLTVTLGDQPASAE